jgi:DNA-binding beta-propeller fold protein YncE
MTLRPKGGSTVGAVVLAAVALAAFARAGQPPVGSLAQLSAGAGCLRAAPNRERCGSAVAIGGGPIVASADGRSVYVAGLTSVAAFARGGDGALRQLSGKAGCVDYRVIVPEPRANARCSKGKLLWPTSAALSRDGRNLYVASWADDPHGDRSDNYSDLAVFARNRRTGAVRQLAGRLGCLGPSTRGGCTVGRALSGPESVVASPDGRNVYVGSFGGLAVFARSPRSGALLQLRGTAGCLLAPAHRPGCSHRGTRPQAWPAVLAASADGRNVYALTVSGDGDALLVFRRNRTTGALTRLATRDGCIASPASSGPECTAAPSFVGPSFCFSLAVSGDGRNVYLGSCGDLTVFSRNARTGGLTQLPALDGCIDASGPPGHPCAGDTGTEPQTGIAISPDGKNLYFAFNVGRSAGATTQPGGITAFSRNPTDGSLMRLRAANGCITETGSRGECTKGRGVESPHGLAISPDGRNVYTSGFAGRTCCRDGDVAVFRRAT